MSGKDIYQELAKSIGAAGSPIIPKIFRILADEEEAGVLYAASPPATAQALAKKTGIPIDRAEEIADRLYKKGMMFTSSKGGPTRYYRVRHVGQFHDATAVAKDVSRECLDLWREYMTTEWSDYLNKMLATVSRPPARIIPINISLEPKNQIMAFDDVMQVIEGARRLAVTNCSCRVIDGSCRKPVETCIQVNRAADYAIKRGTGREVNAKETADILKMCEEAGLVHVSDNARAVDLVICNCCGCCCMNWPGSKGEPIKFASPSRFTAKVDSELCTACETCIDSCYFGAIKMDGQNDLAFVNGERCMGCGLCIVSCPSGALSLLETRPEAFVPE